MSTPEQSSGGHDLRRMVIDNLDREPLLVPEHGVELRLASSEYAEPVAALYTDAYKKRGDYFASRYNDPERQIFSPVWLAEQEFQDPEHLRFVFTDSGGRLLGVTGFFHDRDSTDGTPLMTSDATQIAPDGRGEHIMGHFFKRVVPLIEASDAGIITDFVLTPESMSLRRTLQAELGMVALGIHPHALYHRAKHFTRSEISAAYYPTLIYPRVAILLPEFERLYRIVQEQLPILGEPQIVSTGPIAKPSHLTEDLAERVREKPVDAASPQEQAEALEAGWAPVGFDPDRYTFEVAKFPRERPDLSFILTNEHVPANQQLVRYLNEVLFSGQG